MHMCFHDVGADIIRPCGEGLERLHGIGEFAESIRFVILSGGQSPESKDLRTGNLHSSFETAKILRRASLAQDDRSGDLSDSLRVWL